MEKPLKNLYLLEPDPDTSSRHEVWSEIMLNKKLQPQPLPKPKKHVSFFPPDLLQSLPPPPPPPVLQRPRVHQNQQAIPYVQRNTNRQWNMRFR
jgi:hypothetical protein